MDPQIKATFDELLKLEENTHCFDCGETADEWASVNNGIFLCDKCAMTHKKFGVNISSIRHIKNDPWSDIHLLMMINGGNAKLREFFDKYYIPKDGPKDFKYRTKAGFFYRKQLRALAEGTFFPDPIDADEALELENDVDPNLVPDYEYGFKATIPKEESGLNKMYSFLEKKFDKAATKTKETASNLTGSIKESKFTEDLKLGVNDVKTTIVTESKNVVGFFSDKFNDPNLKQNIVDFGGKINSGVKSGFMSAFGFFKGLANKENTEENNIKIEEDKYETINFSQGNQSDNLKQEPAEVKPQEVLTENKGNTNMNHGNEIPEL